MLHQNRPQFATFWVSLQP